MQLKNSWFHWCVFGAVQSCFILTLESGAAAPPGFVKSTIALDAPPVGLAFDADGVLFALEGADFGSNQATLREILPDGTYGSSFPILGDDTSNFFAGGMAYDPLGDRLLITDNTADGRLYAVDKLGVKETLATGIAGIAGVAVRDTGEIFVSTSPFGAPGEVLQVERTGGDRDPVLGNLGFGAGLTFDLIGNLIVQDAATSPPFLGRLQRLPISDNGSQLEFGEVVPLIDGLQASAGLTVDSEGEFFTTGSGGLFQIAGSPVVATSFDSNGSESQFATAIAFDPGSLPFESFSGPDGGRLAFTADFGFASQDTFVTLLTPARPGDYNTDGTVDELDYTEWRGAFGSMTELAADGNGDGVVDAADYVIWRRHVAESNEMTHGIGRGSVPEPTSLASAIMALAALGALRRSRQPARSQPG